MSGLRRQPRVSRRVENSLTYEFRETYEMLEQERYRVVYAIEGKKSRLIKIGHSLEPERRMRDFQMGSGEQLRILMTMPGGQEHEQRLHAMFAEFRSHGEWFLGLPPVREFVRTAKRRAFQEGARKRRDAEIDERLEDLYERCRRWPQAAAAAGIVVPVAPPPPPAVPYETPAWLVRRRHLEAIEEALKRAYGMSEELQ